MRDLNFLGGKDKDWILKNFGPIPKTYTLQKNDVIVKSENLRKAYISGEKFSILTNFHLKNNKNPDNYLYDIYDVRFIPEISNNPNNKKIRGVDRKQKRHRAKVKVFQSGRDKTYPFYYKRYEYNFGANRLSQYLLLNKSSILLNWIHENPLEMK